jgi:hypothetical protein
MSDVRDAVWASKRYIGDGCYVGFDGERLWLSAEDGVNITNVICLEPEVFAALAAYAATKWGPQV